MEFRVSSPVRICLFGEHQDFLGLPVISTAMNLRFEITAKERSDNLYVINMPDIGERVEFVPSEELEYTTSCDYLKSSINLLKRKFGLSFETVFEFTFRSKIPINSGCGSSSTMVVTWITALLDIHHVRVTPVELAELAFQAEVLEFGESGGKMDHYTSVLGGILFLDFSGKPTIYEKLKTIPDGFFLGDSLEPKATVDILRKSRNAAEEGFKNLNKFLPDFDIKKTKLEDVQPYLSELSEIQKKVVYTQLGDRDLLREAYTMFHSGTIDEVKFGKMLLTHHQMLRDGLGASTPKIEKMLEATLKVGALGGKINGSGGGETMFVYAPGKQKEVARAIEEAGGKAFIIFEDYGTSIF